MPYEMNPAQYENVLRLGAKERYSHFVGKVADWEQLWVLVDRKGGWLMLVTPDEIVYASVWPHPEYASKIAEEFYPDYSPEEVSLNDFLEVILPKLGKDNQKVGVFPDSEGKTWLIEPADLLKDLQEECRLYE